MKSSIFSKIASTLVSIILATASPIAGAVDQLTNTRQFVATQDYREQTVEGWVVHVNKELLNSRKDLGNSALSLLAQKLREIRKLVPPTALDKIMRVPIWLGVNDYAVPNPSYHPSASWLINHGWNPDKAKSVEIGSAQTFIDWSPSQPMMVLHELAHSYHHLVLGHENRNLLYAFEQAKASRKYEAVLRNGKLERAYALNNSQEFFAEATEAYFGRNDYYPTTREELRAFDPITYEIIEKVWEVDQNQTSVPATGAGVD